MPVIKQTIPFCITKMPHHSSIKNRVLNLIKNMGTHSLIEEHTTIKQRISNTDFHLSSGTPRTYIELLAPLIQDHCITVANELQLPFNIECVYMWFQQYEKGDYHNWHVHAGSLFSNVYYVDLPQGASKTSFKVLDEEFTIDVEEGDILTFPGSMLHCSKPNQVDEIKTVIAFNTTEKVITKYKFEG